MLWSTLDQGLSSGSNFLLVFLLARGAAPIEFGIMMIGYSIVIVAVTVSRNAFGGILGLDLPRQQSPENSELVARSLTSVVLLALPVSTALLVFAALVPTTFSGAIALGLLALALPVILVQDLQRFWAVSIGSPAHAAASDLVWLLVALGGFALPKLAPGVNPTISGAAIWSLGGLLGSLLLMVIGYRTRPLQRGLLRWLESDSRRHHLAWESLLASVSPLAASSMIATVGGPAIVAAIRGAGTLFGPLNLLSATIPMALVPEALASGPRRAKRLFLAAAVGFGTIAALWGVALHVLPSRAGTALLGESWSLVHAIILITAMEYVGIGLWGVARARLRVQGRLRTSLRLRKSFTITIVTLPVLALLMWGTTEAVAISMATTTTLFGIASTLIARTVTETVNQ
jgi:O-antigen/teichoic acid export membrane protein